MVKEARCIKIQINDLNLGQTLEITIKIENLEGTRIRSIIRQIYSQAFTQKNVVLKIIKIEVKLKIK